MQFPISNNNKFTLKSEIVFIKFCKFHILLLCLYRFYSGENKPKLSDSFVGAILAVALNTCKTGRGKPYPQKPL